MDIIYLSSSCSESKFNELLQKKITQKLPQAQKYHRLMMEGIAKCIDGDFFAISAFPTNRTWSKKVFFEKEIEFKDNIKYIYGRFINLPLFRQMSRIFETKRILCNVCKNKQDTVIICDVLNQSLAKAARIYGKRFHIPVIGIVTDVPGYTSRARRKTLSFPRKLAYNIAEKYASKSLGNYDAYLLLTEAMNDVVNTNEKPYIVIEGQADYIMSTIDNDMQNKDTPKVVMYAGGIHREFGIERMVNAFLRFNPKDWHLCIYGDGNYQHDLREIASKTNCIEYYGTQPNDVVVKRQLTASLLINPRLTDAEYVKYSFPSKTMECMVSGTPLLTTRLPGMPAEYYDYVYFIDDESEDGMVEAFNKILDKSSEELHSFGTSAKQFIISEKTNIKQAKKFVDFIVDVRNEYYESY